MNTLTLALHEDSDFSELYEAVVKQMQKAVRAAKAEAEPKAPKKTKPVQAMPAVVQTEKVSAVTAQKKRVSKGLVIGIVAVVVLIIAGIGVSALSNRETPATETLIPIEAPTGTKSANLPVPAATDTLEAAPTATETAVVTPTLSPYHSVVFDPALANWDSPFLTSGKPDKLNVHVVDGNGNLAFDITGGNVWAYLVYKGFKYTDVRIDATAVNLGMNENSISLICRFSERGWYEFNIGNDGTYSILAGKGDIKVHFYEILADGGSKQINTGQATNKYSAICKDDSLTLLINDEQVRTVKTGAFDYGQGKIGISVSSFSATPVLIQFESVAISQP